jgi:hypothetical protein
LVTPTAIVGALALLFAFPLFAHASTVVFLNPAHFPTDGRDHKRGNADNSIGFHRSAIHDRLLL